MTTEERLATVERELAEAKAQTARAKRRTRWLLVALGLGLGALALVWASASTVRAERFELVDGQGEVRAVLSVEDGGTSLVLTSAEGKGKVQLGAGAYGSGLALLDENGRMGAGLSAVKGKKDTINVHGLILFDENGSICASLGMTAFGPDLSLFDENGKPRAMLVVNERGPGLNLFDAAGKPIWRAP